MCRCHWSATMVKVEKIWRCKPWRVRESNPDKNGCVCGHFPSRRRHSGNRRIHVEMPASRTRVCFAGAPANRGQREDSGHPGNYTLLGNEEPTYDGGTRARRRTGSGCPRSRNASESQTDHDTEHVVIAGQHGGFAYSTNGEQHDTLVKEVNEAALDTAQVCRVMFHGCEQRSVDFRISQNKWVFTRDPTFQRRCSGSRFLSRRRARRQNPYYRNTFQRGFRGRRSEDWCSKLVEELATHDIKKL